MGKILRKMVRRRGFPEVLQKRMDGQTRLEFQLGANSCNYATPLKCLYSAGCNYHLELCILCWLQLFHMPRIVQFGLQLKLTWLLFFTLFAEHWMRLDRDFDHANQETNGAIEAWHHTLKLMIRQKIGDIKALRLDRIIHMLFTCVLPFFWYNLRAKALERKRNYKKEEIILSSLHHAKFNMTNDQVWYGLWLQLSIVQNFCQWRACNF